MAELSLHQLHNLVETSITTLTNKINTKQDTLIYDSTHRWFTDTERTKLSDIEAGAQVNVKGFATLKVGTISVQAGTTADAFELVAGTNLTITADTSSKRITINALAAPYTHPATHPANIIVQDANSRFVTDIQIGQWNAAASGLHTHTKSQITDFAHMHTAADISGAVNLATKATTAISIPTSDIGGNIWLANTVTGIDGVNGAVAFGSSTEPANPQVNQIWFDVTNRLIKFYDGANWQPFGAAYM